MIDLVAEQSPLGGLERWLHDPTVTEVMVNGGSEVWIERGGRLEHVGSIRATTLLGAIEHILAPIGRRLDRTHPTVDARLADGSRLCAVVEPVAVDGPCLAIRRFSTRPIPLDAFAATPVAELLRELVDRRCNLLVSGATSSGKTTLLNALASEVEHQARLITLEDVAELRLPHPHVVRLETREATPDGVGEVTLAHLLRTALRMRPDRLVVGEIRGSEAVHLLQALNTGHDGSLATVHANSALDALERLASLVLHEVGNWPLAAVHQHVGRAIDVVVHVVRGDDGARRVAEVAEVVSGSALWVRPLTCGDAVIDSVGRGRR
ncbi:MAG TPA: ATPase, T2SS/T4P/T4SS family [Ilumatobacteraceae bacterium]|nr:ATPase, T2SS/T4P/T4SS family [Ilumatobacteraceae bacterium]HRB02229.1 ATPase, T2SS/T4P/T4SS family [Ilumatobacteraceae bacterium]